MCKLNVFVALGLEHRSTAADTENGGARNNNTPTEVLTVENRTTNLSSPETSPNFHTDIAFEEREPSDNSSEVSSNSSNQGHTDRVQANNLQPVAAVNHPYDSHVASNQQTRIENSKQIEENPPTPAYEPAEIGMLESDISPSHIPLTLKTVVSSSSSSPRTDTESRNTTPLPGIEEVIRQPGFVNESFQDEENTVKNDK